MARLYRQKTQDADDQASALYGWTQRFEQLGKGSFRGEIEEVILSEGVLYREHTNRRLHEEFHPPEDHIAIAIPFAIQAGSLFAGQELTMRTLMVLSGREGHEVVAAGELGVCGVSVRRSVLEESLDLQYFSWLMQAEQLRSVSISDDVAEAIRRQMLGASGNVDAPIGGGDSERAVLISVFSAIVESALSGDGKQSSMLAMPRRHCNRSRIVRRAIEFMHANLHGETDIPEICAAAFASRRTLQYCFEEQMGTTPMAYFRALRLNEARRCLKRQSDPSITGLASALGFSSPSHFTRHYKQMFDELPSATVRDSGG
jgi:AraC family ethanolamine operon transcriptional activator